MIMGVLNVFFRDVGQFFGILLQFWFWFTPIVYPVTLPPAARDLLVWNPMVPIVMASYQNILLYGRVPDWMALLPVPCWLWLFACLACGCSASARAKWWMNSDGQHSRQETGQGLQTIR
jgi:lipopolysaccharide transport system permease protein